ncbi:BAHD acyltransferase DCR, partial [Cucurbita argyrosperma subsp. argyrosperma]
MPSSTTVILSNSTVFPDRKSAIKKLKLSVSDLPMLSCHYIQKGVLLTSPPSSFSDLIFSLKRSLSAALSHFPALAGRFTTDHDGAVYLICNDAGVDFIEAKAKHLSIDSVLSPLDVPICFKSFFAFDKTLSYSGHYKPLAAVQVTELADGVFVGCIVNHAVVDGTSFWHFFNTFAEINLGKGKISNSPDFDRNTAFNSPAVLKFPAGGPKETFDGNSRLRERIFHFSREAISRLKLRANGGNMSNGNCDAVETLGKQLNDGWKIVNGKQNDDVSGGKLKISSFQSLSAQLWRSVTRARKLNAAKTTTFRMAVNCRHRLQPPMSSLYFGNAIQSIPTVALVGELLSEDLGWCSALLHHQGAAAAASAASAAKPAAFPRNRKRLITVFWVFRLPKSGRLFPGSFLRRIGAKVVKVLRYVSLRKRSASPASCSSSLKSGSNFNRSHSVSESMEESHRAEAVKDCINFFNSSSSSAV